MNGQTFEECKIHQCREMIDVMVNLYPRHPVIFSHNDWDVQSPPQHSRFHYHSQKVTGSLGIDKYAILWYIFTYMKGFKIMVN